MPDDGHGLHESQQSTVRSHRTGAHPFGRAICAVDLTQNPSTFEQIKDAGFKQIPVVISPNASWSGHQPNKIRQLAQNLAA